jgi:hypothetical protein
MRFSIKSGIVVPILLLAPNLLFFFMPPLNTPGDNGVPLVLIIAENIGRIATLTIPAFYALSFNKNFTKPALVLACLALIIYYAAWIRYFSGGRAFELLGAPLLGIPLPLAVTPTIFLLASSYLLSSGPLLAAALWFGFFHIWISAITM